MSDIPKTHQDLHIKNMKILLEEGEFLTKVHDHPEMGRIVEIMTMIINDPDYFPPLLTVMCQCCAWDSNLLEQVMRQITMCQIKFGIGVSLGSKIELR